MKKFNNNDMFAQTFRFESEPLIKNIKKEDNADKSDKNLVDYFKDISLFFYSND